MQKHREHYGDNRRGEMSRRYNKMAAVEKNEASKSNTTDKQKKTHPIRFHQVESTTPRRKK